MNSHKQHEAIRIITTAAKDYHISLNKKNYLFIYKNKTTNLIEFFESVFLPRNFQHLTGLDFIDSNKNPIHNASFFFQKCLHSALKENEIQFKADGTTELKLQALPLIINFLKSSKMTATYNCSHSKLYIDRLVGTTNFCLGFTKDNNYYVPSSCLLEDIRNLTNTPNQVIAIFSKHADKSITTYTDIRYISKKIDLSQLILPAELLCKLKQPLCD